MNIELTELGLQLVEQIKSINPVTWAIIMLLAPVLFGYVSYSLWNEYLWNNRLSTYAISHACGILAILSLAGVVILSLINVFSP